MPVFVINGFLESGKTQFITNTLQQDYFQADGTTVLISARKAIRSTIRKS